MTAGRQDQNESVKIREICVSTRGRLGQPSLPRVKTGAGTFLSPLLCVPSRLRVRKMQRKNQADSHARPSSFALGLLWRDEPASPKIKIGCLDQQDKQDGNPSVYSVYSVVKKTKQRPRKTRNTQKTKTAPSAWPSFQIRKQDADDCRSSGSK